MPAAKRKIAIAGDFSLHLCRFAPRLAHSETKKRSFLRFAHFAASVCASLHISLLARKRKRAKSFSLCSLRCAYKPDFVGDSYVSRIVVTNNLKRLFQQ